MSFPDHFSAVAARYATFRPHYPDALVDELADRSPPGTAWDVGCGSGQLSIALTRRFARVIATDPARAQLAAAPAHPSVEYRCVPAEASGLPDASVALAVAAQAAHWFDWPRFVAEVGRVTSSGGLIALVLYGNTVGDFGDEPLHEFRHAVEPYWPRERAHVWNQYRDLVLPWPAIEPPTIDMTARWTRDELLGYVSTWSATQRLVAQAGPAAFDRLRDQLAAVWSDDDRRLIRWPLTIKLVRR